MDHATDRWTSLIGAGIIIVGAVIIFTVYTFLHRDEVQQQVASFATVFIKSSPVVEQQLGDVHAVKEVKERRITGVSPGWYLDYMVAGQNKTGNIEMRLTPNPNYGQWSVALAKLKVDHGTPVNLR
jgi:hypothetical protein